MNIKTLVKQYYFLIILFTVVDFLFGSGYVAFMSHQGISDSSIGLILSIWSGVTLLFGIPFGVVADNLGRKRVMGIGFLIWGIGLLLFSLSTVPITFGIAIFLIALGLAIIGQLPLSWFVSTSNKLGGAEVQDNAIPFAEALSKGVSFCAGILFTLLVVNSSGNIPYYVASLLAIATGVVILTIFQADSREEKKTSTLISSIKDAIPFLKKNTVLILFFIKYFLSGIAGQLFVFCWQLYMVNELKVDENKLGVIFSFFVLTLALGYYFTAKLGKNFNKINVSLLGNVIIVISFLVMFLGNSFIVFLIASLLFEFGLGVEQGANLIWIQPEIREDIRATILSLLSVILGISSLLASGIISIFLSQIGFRLLWIISAILAILAVILLWLIKAMKSL
mgnify:CR=1 FL=1